MRAAGSSDVAQLVAAGESAKVKKLPRALRFVFGFPFGFAKSVFVPVGFAIRMPENARKPGRKRKKPSPPPFSRIFVVRENETDSEG